MLLETDVVTSQEVVSGKFWTNTEVKTIYYGPIVFVVQVDGDVAVALFAQGRGYTLSDALSITGGGGSANMTVTGISSNGAITDFTLTPGATITSTTIVVLDASGGTGTGARFAAVKFM